MKQNIEIDIPEGYEVSHSDIISAWDDSSKSGNNIVMTYLKKKQQKDFNWYIDEYLREDPFTTKENLSNHLLTEDIKQIKADLTHGNYTWVPWEIKIGLFRFICENLELNTISCLSYCFEYTIHSNVSKIISQEFIDSLKQNKN